MLTLSFHAVDSGFCRIYYTMPPKEGTRKLLYCFQEEWSQAQAEKYGYPRFKLYRCSLDGEPDYEIPLEKIETVEQPPLLTSWERDVWSAILQQLEGVKS